MHVRPLKLVLTTIVSFQATPCPQMCARLQARIPIWLQKFAPSLSLRGLSLLSGPGKSWTRTRMTRWRWITFFGIFLISNFSCIDKAGFTEALICLVLPKTYLKYVQKTVLIVHMFHLILDQFICYTSPLLLNISLMHFAILSYGKPGNPVTCMSRKVELEWSRRSNLKGFDNSVHKW